MPFPSLSPSCPTSCWALVTRHPERDLEQQSCGVIVVIAPDAPYCAYDVLGLTSVIPPRCTPLRLSLLPSPSQHGPNTAASQGDVITSRLLLQVMEDGSAQKFVRVLRKPTKDFSLTYLNSQSGLVSLWAFKCSFVFWGVKVFVAL